MNVSCNPGSWLEVRGNFEISGAEGEGPYVYDRETLEQVSLADLLRSFRMDPSDPIVGRLRITIMHEAFTFVP